MFIVTFEFNQAYINFHGIYTYVALSASKHKYWGCLSNGRKETDTKSSNHYVMFIVTFNGWLFNTGHWFSK